MEGLSAQKILSNESLAQTLKRSDVIPADNVKLQERSLMFGVIPLESSYVIVPYS
jgi:hypothetical protein